MWWAPLQGEQCAKVEVLFDHIGKPINAFLTQHANVDGLDIFESCPVEQSAARLGVIEQSMQIGADDGAVIGAMHHRYDH